MKQPATTIFKAKEIHRINKLLPQMHRVVPTACTCNRCRYVNMACYNFCTNCGYPTKEEGTQTLYQLRLKQRKDLLIKSEQDIYAARVTLYLLSAFFQVSIAFLFGNLKDRYVLALAGVIMSVLFFILARWSFFKPFTALITAFIIILTFSTIAVFGEFAHAFTSVQGVYSILVSMVLIYFLLRGIQSAYKADLIKDEMEIV